MMGAASTAGTNATNDQTGGNFFNQSGLPGVGGRGGTIAGGVDFSDPAGYGITKIFGDPLNIYGNRNNPNALLFPSSQQQIQGGPFPNLGAASMIPQTPQGAFGAIHNGGGPYNNMAAQGAGGQMFNPAARPMLPQAPQTPMQGGGKPNQGGIGAVPSMLRGSSDKVRH